ncbi:MAG TPA: ROK family protein [Pyrinomonadaceae bacterium]|jgi:glucokinase|nr:ROK family protein [Pyrinomonadaceae bacterium]
MTSPNTTASFIGVDLSGKTIRAALVTDDGRLIERREAPMNGDKLTAQVARIVTELRDVAPNVEAIGVGVRGLVNPRTDRVYISTDLPSVVHGDFHPELMAATGLRVELWNDANAAAYGEYKVGAGRGSRDMFYVTIGTGIGGAIILDGKLWFGASGFAGEFGHITIDAEGVECICGNTGCLETVASAPNIVRRANERLYRDNTSSLSKLALNRDFTAADIAREAKQGDDFALLMIERTGKYIGAAVASVINLLNIERIILGGGVMEAGDLILNAIIREAGRRSFQPCFEATQLAAAVLGTDAVPIGAAMLARDAAQQEATMR